MKHTYCDGQIRQESPTPGISSWRDGSWVDEWWGPGGHLVVTNSGMSKGAMETLHSPDGLTSSKHHLFEGMDYEYLPELFGPELWAEFQEERSHLL